MKSIVNFFKWLWTRNDRKAVSNFESMANNPNFTELTEEEMRTIRSGPVSPAE